MTNTAINLENATKAAAASDYWTGAKNPDLDWENGMGVQFAELSDWAQDQNWDELETAEFIDAAQDIMSGYHQVIAPYLMKLDPETGKDEEYCAACDLIADALKRGTVPTDAEISAVLGN